MNEETTIIEPDKVQKDKQLSHVKLIYQYLILNVVAGIIIGAAVIFFAKKIVDLFFTNSAFSNIASSAIYVKSITTTNLIIFGTIMIVLSLWFLIVAINLRKLKKWARVFLIIWSAISIVFALLNINILIMVLHALVLIGLLKSKSLFENQDIYQKKNEVWR